MTAGSTDEEDRSAQELETLSVDLVHRVNDLWVEFCSPAARSFAKGLAKGSPGFPSSEWLDHLLGLVREIAGRTGRKKVRGRFTWGAFEHVQKRYAGTKLIRCVRVLVSDYSGLPEEPARRLSRECLAGLPKASPQTKAVKIVIDHVRRRALDLELSTVDPAEVLGTLRPFGSEPFRRAEKSASFADPLKGSRPLPVTAFRFWAIFVDLVAQQADWEARFGRYRHVAHWIAGLHNDSFAREIERHLHSPYAPRQRIAKAFDAEQRRKRTRKWRIGRTGSERSDSPN